MLICIGTRKLRPLSHGISVYTISLDQKKGTWSAEHVRRNFGKRYPAIRTTPNVLYEIRDDVTHPGPFLSLSVELDSLILTQFRDYTRVLDESVNQDEFCAQLLTRNEV